MTFAMFRLKIALAACAAASLLAAGCGDDTPDETATDVAADVAVDAPADTEPDAADVADAEPDVSDVSDTGAEVSTDVTDADGHDADVEPDVFPTDPMEWALGEAGPYQVGYRSYEIEYERPDRDGTRTISVSVWYPTEDTSGRSPAYLGAFLDPVPFEDATPAAPIYDGGYPVHVHSHGFQGYSGTSAFLMRHYASHGWLAVAPDHIGNTLLDHEDPLDNAHYFLKSTDISESLDLIAELPAEDPLAGLPSVERVLMSGHSFGTYACWSVGGATYDEEVVRAECEDLSSGPCTPEELEVFLSGDLADDRVVAIVPLAGTYRTSWFGDTGHASVDIPILAMTGSEDNPSSSQTQWDRLGTDTDMRWVDLEGGCHQTFALGGCTTLPMIEGFGIVSSYVLAFGRHYVLGDEGTTTVGILDGSVQVSERATLLGGER